jgi:hypothetical protein
MEMIRQHHPAMNPVWVALPNPANDFAEHINMPRQQIIAMTLEQVDREEVGAAWMPGAAVIRHGGSIAG